VNKAILIILFIGITLLGCSDNFDNSIVSTSITSENITSPKLYNPSDSTNSIFYANAITALEGPILSEIVDGAICNELIIDTTYINSEGREIDVYVRLKFPAGAFEGKRTITMLPNAEDLSIQLFPHITFNKIVKVDFVITGLDLEAMGYTRNAHVDFVYFSPFGDIELIQNQGSNVNIPLQRISLRAGTLHHFSRYGWIRKQL
jgi:hypothetical protein